MKYSLAGLFSLLMILFCASQASGDLRTISPGGTVFLGEEGLDISATGVMNGGQIGWWAPGSSRSSDPTELMTVSSPDSFYVSPSAFSGKEGLWYSWPEGSPVFQVKGHRYRSEFMMRLRILMQPENGSQEEMRYHSGYHQMFMKQIPGRSGRAGGYRSHQS